MEHDVVLADEVEHTGFGVFPPLCVIVAHKVDGVGDVTDRSVEPYVEHLALGTLHGYGDTPVEVAAHGAGLETHVEPRLALAVDVGLPFLVSFENPLLKRTLPLVEGEVVMLCLAHYGHAAGDGRLRVDEVGGVERCAASLALVAVRSFCAAVGAGSGHVAVGEELSGLLVVELHGCFLYEFSLVVEAAEEVGGHAAVSVGGGASVDIERDAELSERVLDDVVIAVHDVLGGDTLLAGLYGDGYAMLVAAADHEHVLTAQAEIAGVDVGRHIYTGEVADVDRAVGVGESGGDESTFEIFHNFYAVLPLGGAVENTGWWLRTLKFLRWLRFLRFLRTLRGRGPAKKKGAGEPFGLSGFLSG